MAELEQIVQNMMKAGESEDDIKNVVEHYNAEKSRSATDDDFSEAPSWGDKLKRSFDSKGSIMPDLYTKQKREEKGADWTIEKSIEETEKKRKSTPEYSKDKKAFQTQLNAAFKNPNIIKDILQDEETLQNVSIGKGGQPVRNPEEGLKDYFHEQIKGFGWFGGGERAIDPDTGKPYYSNLTNRDIDELIDGIFDNQLSQESTNTRNSRINLKEFTHDTEVNSRKADINTFKKQDKKAAILVEEINHGNFTQQEKEDKFDQLKELKKKQGKTDILFNYNTGQLIIPKSEEDKESLLQEDGIKPLKDKSDQYQGLTLDELATEYKMSSLAMGGLNKYLDEERFAIIDEFSADMKPKRIPISFTLRDWMEKGKRYTDPVTGNVYTAENCGNPPG